MSFSSPNTYGVGNLITVLATFVDSTGAPTDPTQVEMRSLDPNGVETDYIFPNQITRTSAGNYNVVIQADVVGSWFFRWDAEGAIVAKKDDLVFVRGTPFVAPY